LEEYDSIINEHDKDFEPEKYNKDESYKKIVDEAIESKMRLQAKFYLELKIDSQTKYVSATLDDFYKGPEELIGSPNPKILQGMQGEHCLRGNSQKEFTTGNYNVTTTPAMEWEFVVEPKEGVPYPHTPKDKTLWPNERKLEWKGENGREPANLEVFMVTEQVRLAGLMKEEVIALRLVSGPMFVLYNAVLRGFPENDVECLKDWKGKENRYETTIFTIASGIAKLSKITTIPSGSRLYRGLDCTLPRQFKETYSECKITFSFTLPSRDSCVLRRVRSLDSRASLDGEIGTMSVALSVSKETFERDEQMYLRDALSDLYSEIRGIRIQAVTEKPGSFMGSGTWTGIEGHPCMFTMDALQNQTFIHSIF
jgi:hypothetical protein